MPRSGLNASLMKPLVVLAFPGMYLVYKISEFKRQQQEHNRRKVTERELAHLNHKIDKLLTKLEEHEPELATSQEEECVVCVSAKASMQTFPCGHRVVCRKCFVKTIQVAVSQRVLPLRCVICRTKIVRLKHSSHGRATPVTPGVRALLSPCEALGASRGPFLRPQDLDAPLNPLPESHYRHSAQACRFHRHSDGESTSEASCSTRTPQRTRTPEPCPESPPVAESLAHDTREEEERHEEPPLQSVQCSGLTRAVVHPPPRSPPEALPKSPPRVAPPAPKSSSPPVSLPNSRAVSPRPKPPPSRDRKSVV